LLRSGLQVAADCGLEELLFTPRIGIKSETPFSLFLELVQFAIVKIRLSAKVEIERFYFYLTPSSSGLIVRGRLDLDLSEGDPPPDLVLEIDITHKSLDRFSLYTRLEVPELWCYNQGELKIYHLSAGEYLEAETSLSLPRLPIRELPQLIEMHRAAGRRAIRKAIREWVSNREH
jgi:Uma2 family endonuclease